MKRNIGIIIVLIIVFGIFFAFTYLAFNDNIQNEEEEPKVEKKDKNIFVFDNNIVLTYSEDKWFEDSIDLYSGKQLSVYDGNNLIGKKEISYNDRWYINDENMNFYNLNSKLFAYTGDYDVDLKVINELESDTTDNNIITSFLANKDVNYNYDNLFIKKYSLDLNENKNNETIYIVINSETLDSPLVGDAFSYAFSLDEDDNIIEFSNSNNECEMDLQNAITMDSKTFVIYSCIYPSNQGIINYVYEYKNAFELILRTELN